jgi:hypothetical protein
MIIFTPNTVIRSTEVNANFEEVNNYAQNLDAGLNHNPYRFRAWLNQAQTINNITFVKIKLNATTYDPNSDFDTTNNRYIIPVDGYYLFAGAMRIQHGGSSGYSLVSICKNGVEVARGVQSYLSATTLSDKTVCDVVYCVKDDYIELFGYLDGGNGALDKQQHFTYMSGFLTGT